MAYQRILIIHVKDPPAPVMRFKVSGIGLELIFASSTADAGMELEGGEPFDFVCAEEEVGWELGLAQRMHDGQIKTILITERRDYLDRQKITNMWLYKPDWNKPEC